VFLESGVCLWLPSDSALRQTPLPLASGWGYHPPQGTCTPKLLPMPGAPICGGSPRESPYVFVRHDRLGLGFPFLTALVGLIRIARALVLTALDRTRAWRQVAVTVGHLMGQHALTGPIRSKWIAQMAIHGFAVGHAKAIPSTVEIITNRLLRGCLAVCDLGQTDGSKGKNG
jgi:hypothetical protein